MILGGKGGVNTLTGPVYEGKVDLRVFLGQQPGYSIDGNIVSYCGEAVGQIFKKNELYTQFLEPRGIDRRNCISSKLLHDNGIYVVVNNTAYIIEVKTQNTPESVDEKLQTCDFKKKQYQKLFFPLNIEVQFIYILDEWLNQRKYKDVLDYIISVGCSFTSGTYLFRNSDCRFRLHNKL